MYCTNCGKQLEPNSNFCTNCGAKQENITTSQDITPSNAKDAQKKAEISLTLYIFFILLIIINLTTYIRIHGFATPCCIASLIFMIISRIKDKTNKLGKRMMIVHIVTGIIFILGVIFIIACLISLGKVFGDIG